MRLIDAEALGIGVANETIFKEREYTHGWNAAIKIIDNAPTIDAVPVVRCKDCKYYRYGKYFTGVKFCQRLPYYAAEGGLNTADDGFCSCGERKEGE